MFKKEMQGSIPEPEHRDMESMGIQTLRLRIGIGFSKTLYGGVSSNSRGSLDRAIGVALSHGMSSLISSNLNKKSLPLRSISGTAIQQSIKAKLLKRNNGKAFCLIQILDISSIANRDKQMLEQVFETKGISQKLAEEKERVKVALDSIADAVIVTNEKGRIVFMNPVAEFLSVVSEEVHVPCPLDNILDIPPAY
ncbi:hypothetical protein GO003_003750 [Methylicorpusculum oleiharenae]|uniref:hypothetical protein n=1 Tax=Methylicorpusculum oleiharenae TaxID=1338687 RepID=UPI001358CBDA|nr:hypothetical protein [Methylicorpusculum oleiharenae]MCD2449498.1 hypothetical protein [Methylicorpusculum oleiharenae]